MDRHRRVEEYVQRQRAYLPTYTTENLVDACYTTPSQLPRSDAEFGFDTPVLRPRAPSKPQATAQQAGPHEARPANQRGRRAPLLSETRDPALGKKYRPKETPTANDTDDERVARLADRRERKRKKRAVVNPPQRDDEPTTAKKKKRTKKPGALALLYGFSATNVTKDRLTLKPAPSLGVFSKGKASAKKKVTATNGSSSRHELFSESAFLNKPSVRAADPLKIADDPDDSLISDSPAPHETRVTKHTRQDPGKYTETSAARTPQAANGVTAESDIWNIEVQSKLPSSTRGVSNEPEARESAPVVVDLCAHGAEWCASVNEDYDKCRNKTRTANPSVSRSQSGEHSVVRASPGTSSGLRDGHCHSDVAGVSSLHPFHSASQVGRRATDTQGSDLRLATSKYFTEPNPKSPVYLTQTSRSGDGIRLPDSQDEDVRDAVLEAGTTRRVASPMSSPTSVPLRVAEFQTRYDMDLHEFESDSCYDRWGVEVPLGPLGGRPHGYFESPIGGTRGDRFISTPEDDYACQGEMWNRYPLVGPATDGVEFEGNYDPLMEGCEGDLEDVDGFFFEEQGEYDTEEGYHVAPIQQALSVCGVEGSIGCDEDSSSAVAGFLEGRALLLDVHERARCGGLSGLIEAERDVASRLRDHWRPLRL